MEIATHEKQLRRGLGGILLRLRTIETTKHENPYRPLRPLSALDRDLLGREGDVAECAALFGSSSRNIIVLHGVTGCGKTSLLRAGLIPLLEQRAGFSFLRDSHRGSTLPLFIRCTTAPLSQLRRVLEECARRPYEVEQPDGTKLILSLREAWARKQDEDDERQALLSGLRRLTELLPRTLVLILDQCEDILKPPDDPTMLEGRGRFARFLVEFADADLDCRLLLALRTEYFGRLLEEYNKQGGMADSWKHHELKDLSEDDLIRAIIRPVESPGSLVRYERAVAQQIAKDLKQTARRGGSLPNMQILCTRIYQKAREHYRGETVDVRMDLYRKMGLLEQQPELFLNEILRDLCRQAGDGSATEVKRWKSVLWHFCEKQGDGTVTTHSLGSEDVMEVARSEGCRASRTEVINGLERAGVLRRQDDRPEVRFLLGHDILGLGLQFWLASTSRPYWRVLITGLSVAIMVLIGLVGLVAVKWGFDGYRQWQRDRIYRPIAERIRACDRDAERCGEILGFYTTRCEGERDAEACLNLGLLYERGHGMERSADKAAGLYRMACQYGDEVGCKLARP